MSFWKKLFGIVDAPAPEPARSPTAREISQVDVHVARYQRALDQCTKGQARREELQAYLTYWQAVAAAAALKPE